MTRIPQNVWRKSMYYQGGWMWQPWVLLVLLFLGFGNSLYARPNALSADSQTVLFNNFPRVALLVKEQYVDPKRINPDAMLASILESLESRIAKLVISLPKTLDDALVVARATDEQKAELAAKAPAPDDPKKTSEKEKLVLDLGGVKKSFDFEPQRSLWGMIFLLRDVFRFIEEEAKKQGLDKASKGTEPLDFEKLESGAINAMLTTLDPHSVYLEPKYARDLTLTTKGEFGGIGIVISVRDGFLTVISPIDETPALKAGVKAKDRIIKIDDDSAINMDLNDAVDLLRGKPNTTVKIAVQRPSVAKELEFTLKRAIIKVESVGYALLDDHVGYLRIKAFQGNTAKDVKDGILAMKKTSKQKMSGLVLDLRGNPGGLLREAVEVSSLFLDGGEVVSTQGSRSDSRQVEMASPGELDPQLKIVILVDGGSASASEIVAAALKDGGLRNGRAVVVGERTFGKGSVQMLFDFPMPRAVEPAALKLTIAEYFGPNNKSMQNIGVDPDVSLSPVFANKLEELKLFPEVTLREADLLGHLASDRPRLEEKKSLVTIEYSAPPPDEEGLEYGKVDAKKLVHDFAVKTALAVIKEAKSPERAELLKAAQEIKVPLQNEENKKISENLKKFGIDWSSGTNDAKSGLKVSVSQNKGAFGGAKMKVAIKVKNTSERPFFQVHGITHAKTPLFDQKEFIFGKINPGQEIERFVEFDIPKDVVARKDLLTLEVKDYRRQKLEEIDVPLSISGLNRPQFAHMAYISDAHKGNGDGVIQQGEEVDLVVFIKNIGEGRAFEPTILLRNESGSKVFLKNGRFQGKELLPNQELATRFSFRVKEPTDKADFEIQIFDGQMHDIWRDKISVPLKKSASLKTSKKTLILKDKEAFLWERPDGQRSIARLRSGIVMHAQKEIDGYYLVKVDDNLGGFISKADVQEGAKVKAKNGIKTEQYSVLYNKVPAKVRMAFGDQAGITANSSGKIVAEIVDAERLTGLMLYVNGKKVLYKDLKKAHHTEKVDHEITLKPGVNTISLFAKESDSFGQRENITVFYDNEGRAAKALPKPVIKAEKP